MYPRRFVPVPELRRSNGSAPAQDYRLFNLSEGYRLGDLIRQSKAGISNNFRADIISFDDNATSGVEPFADIRSTYDQRESWLAKYNADQAAAHDPASSLTPSTGASVGTVSAPDVSAGSSDSVSGSAPVSVD